MRRPVLPSGLLLVSALLCLTSHARAETSAAAFTADLGEKIASLAVEPKSIELSHRFNYCQLLVNGTLKSGEVVDLTRSVKFDAGTLAEVSPTGFVRPKRDGSSELTVSYGDKSVSVPLVVRGMAAPFHPSFVRDVNPVLGKLGCNAGTCHGSKDGKNGFKLSLRGYDAQYDFRSLTDDVFARRFNRAAPDQSLMLLKPTGVVPHQGGALMQPGEPYYEILRGWIADGVKLDLDSPRVAKIDILPQGITIPLPQMSQQMKVIATYTDGSTRDVTAEAFIEPSDIEVLSVDKRGLVTAIRRGEAAALARYEGAYAATPIYVMGDRSGYAWRDVPAYNYVDELVYRKQQKVKVLPGDVCNDAEFIRRVNLDLTGLPPTVEEIRAFLADSRPQREKREELVDRLIGSPAFVEHWTSKWADMLQVNPKFLGDQGAAALRKWIREGVEKNKPYNEFVYEVLSAGGSNIDNPPAAYYKRLRTPEDAMENTTQLFLSIRFNCNKCHDHPFERWTQDQYYHLAAYFAQIERKRDERFKGDIAGNDVDKPVPLAEVIADVDKGEVKHERTGQVSEPKFPYDYPGMSAAAGPRREQMARWLTSKDNPYFAKSYVNRIWSYLMGVGIIEPVDDIRAGNPPTNPELLNRLTEQFISDGFDVRKLMATICKSRSYQLAIATSRWNEGDTVNYSHALARRLPAEVLYDAVHRATGSVSHLPGLKPGSRAAEAIDPTKKLPDAFLDLFGAPPRESACECERSSGVMLGPVMNLIMGPTINDAISDPANDIAKLVAAEKDDARVVEELFLKILNRPATAAEIAAGKKLLSAPLAIEQLDAVRKQVADYERELNDRQAQWEKSLGQTRWTVLKAGSLGSSAGAKLETQEDGSVFVSGELKKDTYSFNVETELHGITGLRIEAMTDKRLPKGGPGRAPNGNFVLSEVTLVDINGNSIPLRNAQADFSQSNYPAAAVLDNNPDTGWAIMPQMNKNHTLIVETVNDLGTGTGTLNFSVRLNQQYLDNKHQLGRFRISVTDAPRPLALDNLPPELAEIIAVERDKRTPAQQNTLTQFYRRDDKKLPQLKTQLARLEAAASNPRLIAAQDLAWALINSPAFIFNR